MKRLAIFGSLTLALVLFGLVGEAQWPIVIEGTQRGGGCVLCTGLEHYWPMEGKIGATWPDTKGTAHLSESATPPTTDAGIHNLAGKFVPASSEYLYVASDATLNFSEVDGFTFSVWVKPNSNIAASKDDEGANRQWLWIGGDFYYFDDGGANISVIATIGGGDLGLWTHLMVWYDPADHKLHSRKNNGAVLNSAGTILTLRETTTEVRLEESAGVFYDGLMDEFAMWDIVLDTPKQDALWAAGAGVFYNGSVFANLWLARPWRYARAEPWLFYRGPRRWL